MSSTLRVFIAALVAAALCAAQDCESTCEPKMIKATKCNTLDCVCYAYDDAAYVRCLRAECGQGYSSVREIQVSVCQGFGVELSPDPPITQEGSDTPTTTAVSPNPKSTSGNTSGGGSGGTSNNGDSGTSSSDSGSNTTQQASGGKDRLSVAELIGIVIGAVSAVATIIGVWVTIRQKKNKKKRANSNATTLPVVYQPIPPPIQTYPSVQTIHVSPMYNQGAAQNYQPPPAYQAQTYNSTTYNSAYNTPDMGWRK